MATILERETDWIDKTEEALEIAIADLYKNHEEAAEGIEKMWEDRRNKYDGTPTSRHQYCVFLAETLANVGQINAVYGL